MTQAKVEAVNDILLAGEPANISIDEHSGYMGYKPQAVVDAMNEILYGEWGFAEISNEIVPGEKSGLAVAKVEVWLKGNEFHPTGWGQNRVTRGDVGDARKGAQTDAIKKALSYFSIGNRAYHGLLEKKSGNSQRVMQQPLKPAASAPVVETPQPQANGHQAEEAQPALTLGKLFLLGKERGLWNEVSGAKFYSFASAVLGGIPVNKQSKLDQGQLLQVQAAIEQEAYTNANKA